MLRTYEAEEPQQEQGSPRTRTIPKAKNRGRLDVVADVLDACSRPVTKNAILIRANVNSVTATYVLTQLIDSRLLDTVVDEERRVSYIATKQGAAFIAIYKELTTMLTPALAPETKAAKGEIGLFA